MKVVQEFCCSVKKPVGYSLFRGTGQNYRFNENLIYLLH